MYTVWHVDNKDQWSLCYSDNGLLGALRNYAEQAVKYGTENVLLCREVPVHLDLTVSAEDIGEDKDWKRWQVVVDTDAKEDEEEDES